MCACAVRERHHSAILEDTKTEQSYSKSGAGDLDVREVDEQLSSWPRFGIVGKSQAALYYFFFLVFTVFFYRESSIANSLGIHNTPKPARM